MKIKKRLNKIQLILFLSIILLSVFSVFSFNVINTKAYTPTIKANWLYVETGNFVDNSPHSWETKIKISSGGGDMWDFENLGMVSSTESEILYKSKATFGFEVTAHTNVDFRNVYPNINLNKEHTEFFFKINREYLGYNTISLHDVSWNSIELGNMRIHDYDGHIPITVGVRDIRGNDGTITLNGQTFDTPAYIADVIKITVTGIRNGKVGDYNDLFTNVADVSGGEVTFQELSDTFSASEQKIINWYDDQNIGWKAGNIEKGQTIQQLMVGGSQRGTDFISPASLNSHTFPLTMQLQPEVFEYIQYNTITSAKITYWGWGVFSGNIDPNYGPVTSTAPKRILAVHTTNNFLHWDFEVEVEFYATVESTAELTQAILDDPYLKAGDMVWDSSFTGDYKVDVPLTEDNLFAMIAEIFEDLFSGLSGIINFVITLVILAVGLYIFIKIGIPLISKRIKKGSKKRN